MTLYVSPSNITIVCAGCKRATRGSHVGSIDFGSVAGIVSEIWSEKKKSVEMVGTRWRDDDRVLLQLMHGSEGVSRLQELIKPALVDWVKNEATGLDQRTQKRGETRRRKGPAASLESEDEDGQR
jgi:hypothetical protein